MDLPPPNNQFSPQTYEQLLEYPLPMEDIFPTPRTEWRPAPLHDPSYLWDPAMQPYGGTAICYEGSIVDKQAPSSLGSCSGMAVDLPNQYPAVDESATHGQPLAPLVKPRKRKAPTMRDDDWAPVKARIIELHTTQNLPLPEVKKKVEEEFQWLGFTATLRQYRTRVTKWGQDKNVKWEEMEAIVRKRQKRRLIEMDKGELIFKVRGNVVQTEKIDRWMKRNGITDEILFHPSPSASTPAALSTQTVSERGSPSPKSADLTCISSPTAMSHIWPPVQYPGVCHTTPSTPANVQAPMTSRYQRQGSLFENLPILQLEESMKNFLGSLTTISGASFNSENLRIVLNSRAQSPNDFVIDSLLPRSVFTDTPFETAMATDLFSRKGILLFLYLISNDFPAETRKGRIYQLVRGPLMSDASVFRTLKCHLADSLLEKLFTLAVEAEDLPMVKSLIKAGANIDAINCKVAESWVGLDRDEVLECAIPLTPLQFACLVGNAPLVQELLAAGSKIDTPEPGWKCSAILLAIHGSQYDLRRTDLNGSLERRSMGEEDLLDLVEKLFIGGASVNVGQVDTSEIEAIRTWRKGLRHPLASDKVFYDIIVEQHSPLTLASNYKYKKLVDYLISAGADVQYCMDGTSSALRQCFSSTTWYESLSPMERSGIANIAHSLIQAGADLNDFVPCDFFDWGQPFGIMGPLGEDCEHFDLKCYSILDLAILINSSDLIDAILYAGARTTQYTLGMALEVGSFEIFSKLIANGVTIPSWATTSDDEEEDLPSPDALNTDPEYANGLEHFHKNLLFLASIRFGATGELKNLINSKSPSESLVDDGYGFTAAIEGCCKDGHFETLQFLLTAENMPKIPLSADYGCSVYLSIENDHENLLDLLIGNGADVNRRHFGETPIHLAVQKGDLETVRKLIQASARLDIELRCRRDCCGTSEHKHGNPLITAIESGNSRIIEQLLGPYINIKGLGRGENPSHDTCEYCNPITAAIRKQNWTLVDRLLICGANVNDYRGLYRPFHSPLSAATDQKRHTLAKLLVAAGATVNDERALLAAIDDNDLFLFFVTELAKIRTLNRTDNALHVALEKAIKKNDFSKVQIILESQLVDLSAARDSNTLRAALFSNDEVRYVYLGLLLTMGTDPNSFVLEEETALLTAIRRSDAKSTKMLLDAGAATNPEVRFQRGHSPAQQGAKTGNPEILQTLLTYGCDPNAVGSWKTDTGMGSAVQIATWTQNIEILKILLAHGAEASAVTEDCPHTALQIASREGNQTIVEILLAHGANVNAPPADHCGATALQFAALCGYLGVAHFLIEKGADVNAHPAKSQGRTALEGAAEHGRIDMVQLLINAGADLSETGNGQYQRALKRALNNGHFALHKLLLRYSAS